MSRAKLFVATSAITTIRRKFLLSHRRSANSEGRIPDRDEYFHARREIQCRRSSEISVGVSRKRTSQSAAALKKALASKALTLCSGACVERRSQTRRAAGQSATTSVEPL